MCSSDLSGDMTVEVNSTMTTRQSIAMAQVIPQYRYTEGLGRRRLLTPDEVLRLPNDELLIIIRGQKVLRARKFDYTGHPYAKECVKASILDYKSNHTPSVEPEIIPAEPVAAEEKRTKENPQSPSASGPAQPPTSDTKGKGAPKSADTKHQPAAAQEPGAPPAPSQQPGQPSPPKPTRRPKTLYESSRPPADF